MNPLLLFCYHLFIAKLMVISGFPLEGNGAANVIPIEGDPLEEITCPDLPFNLTYEIYGGTGGHFPHVPLQSTPKIMVCGGYNKYGKHLRTCSVSGKEPHPHNISLFNERNYASSIIVFEESGPDTTKVSNLN